MTSADKGVADRLAADDWHVPHTWVRGPLDNDELWEAVYTLTGRKFVRKATCADHVAPFDAFADVYFGREQVSVIHGSRGFAGKSVWLGTLALCQAVFMGADIVILGGSAAQSLRVRETIDEAIYHPRFPRSLIERDPTRFDIFFNNGGHIRALMASQRSVRGPHPQILLLDEVDEMDLEIFEASLGQPMSKNGIPALTVVSSTWQYPDATFAEVMKRAEDNGWPINQWCYKESASSPDGWLPQQDIEIRRSQVTSATWNMEFDLQEPSFEGRAIDLEAVEVMWDKSLGEFDGAPMEYIEIEGKQEKARYAHGADWAKEKDWTVVETWRVDTWPWRLVAFQRLGRLPWPQMIQMLDDRIDQYGGVAAHDATGIGNVVHDLLDHDAHGVVMAGRRRDALLSEYIAAIEDGALLAPRIEWAYREHRYARLEDVYGTGHTPDSVVAGAMAWSVREEAMRGALPPIINITREGSPWTIEQQPEGSGWRQ